MTEEHETHPLPSAEPATRAPSSTRFVVIALVMALPAIASLWFVPLAVHIYSCTERPKWCHVQAFMLGVPSGVVCVVLLAVTASFTLAPQEIGKRSRQLKIAA